ncbi:unnamed protein product, partial [Soboliphyme baturini]|uniref:Ig-like domain-containing protein n=1 Tax=Soboliphyme baturini TaxID=241478 RepID=A0A183II76_9BILA
KVELKLNYIQKSKFCEIIGQFDRHLRYFQPVYLSDAPEFKEKPKIAQRDGGELLVIKMQAISKTEMKVEWLKNDKPLEKSDRVKANVEKDAKDPQQYLLSLEIKKPTKEDEAKYTCVVKNEGGQNRQSINLSFE